MEPDQDDCEARRLWFRERVLPLEPHLRSYVRRIVRDAADVDDVVHETLIRLMSAPGWRSIASPPAFIRTVARNMVHDLFRHRNVVPIYYMADLETTNVIDETADPELTTVGRDDLRYLAQLVEGLPPQCRKVFTLRKVYGLSNGAIAAQLGLSVSTVEKHMVKALRICSEGLARRDTEDPTWRAYGSRPANSKKRTED